jgi:hypothetical protein
VKRIDGTMGAYPLGIGRAEPTAPVGRSQGFRARPPRLWRKIALVEAEQLTEPVEVETPEGVMQASAGDYLAQHQDGHAWPIKRETFEGTYEEVA